MPGVRTRPGIASRKPGGNAGWASGNGKRGHPEDDLQAEIVRWHAAAVRQGDAILFAVPNGEKRDPVTAARLTGISAANRDAMPEGRDLLPFGLGVLPGVTDLVLVLPAARVCWVELKIPDITWPPANLPAAGPRQLLHRAGRLDKRQRRFRDGVAGLGHAHRVVRYLSEYAELLEELGVPLRCPKPWGPGVAPPRPVSEPTRAAPPGTRLAGPPGAAPARR